MTLSENINSDLKNAMRNKDKVALRGIRAIKSALLLASTEKGAAGEMTPEKEIQLLQKLVKQRKDSLEIFTKQGREDLAAKEKEEIALIEQYLPKQISEEALTEILRKIISDTEAQSLKDMGKVIGAANKQLAGKADGKTIAAKVKQLLGA